MKKHLILAGVLALVLLPQVSHASGCYQDPIYDRADRAKVVIAVRVRDGACMEGTVVKKILPVGRVVEVTGETDGWYRVRDSDGTEGWVGATLVQLTNDPLSSDVVAAPVPAPVATPVVEAPAITSPSVSVDWYDQDHSGELSAAAPPGLARANYPSGCYVDPVPSLSGNVRVVIGARVRDGACMVGTIVKKTLPVGRVVSLIARTDGWYKIRDADGVEGWVGAQLLTPTDAALSLATPTATSPVVSAPTSAPTDLGFMKTTSGVRMRSLPSTRGVILRTLKGGQTLTVIKKGSGWTYLRDIDGKEGWVANWYLKKTLIAPVSTSPSTTPAAPTTPAFSATQSDFGNISLSKYQQGTIPTEIDVLELNRYWIGKINALRTEKGLRQLTLDQRWVDTATDYAGYMGQTGVTGHERADGSTMHQWIDKKGLPFTTRYSTDGWQTNYFTENISWNQIAATTADAKRALDDSLKFYLSEAATNGPHYRTIYHPDWNSEGAGFFFKDLGNGQVKFYQVFHYGSLQK